MPFSIRGQAPDEFARAVSPLLTGTCEQCHNERMASGGLNVATLSGNNSFVEHRADWEKILRRVQAGEMPPSSVRKPEDQTVRNFISAIQTAFERADAVTP